MITQEIHRGIWSSPTLQKYSWPLKTNTAFGTENCFLVYRPKKPAYPCLFFHYQYIQQHWKDYKRPSFSSDPLVRKHNSDQLAKRNKHLLLQWCVTDQKASPTPPPTRLLYIQGTVAYRHATWLAPAHSSVSANPRIQTQVFSLQFPCPLWLLSQTRYVQISEQALQNQETERQLDKPTLYGVYHLKKRAPSYPSSHYLVRFLAHR